MLDSEQTPPTSPVHRDCSQCDLDALEYSDEVMGWVCPKCDAEFHDAYDPCPRCPGDDAPDGDCRDCGGSGFVNHRMVRAV